jgi:hypothetical protein
LAYRFGRASLDSRDARSVAEGLPWTWVISKAIYAAEMTHPLS